jgi:hypothetical protein
MAEPIGPRPAWGTCPDALGSRDPIHKVREGVARVIPDDPRPTYTAAPTQLDRIERKLDELLQAITPRFAAQTWMEP